MIWVAFIGGLTTGVLLVGLALLMREILEIGSDMDVIRQHAEDSHRTERERAEALVDRYEARREAARWN